MGSIRLVIIAWRKFAIDVQRFLQQNARKNERKRKIEDTHEVGEEHIESEVERKKRANLLRNRGYLQLNDEPRVSRQDNQRDETVTQEEQEKPQIAAEGQKERPSRTEISKMNKDQMKQKLKSLGANSDGNRKELRERLRAIYYPDTNLPKPVGELEMLQYLSKVTFSIEIFGRNEIPEILTDTVLTFPIFHSSEESIIGCNCEKDCTTTTISCTCNGKCNPCCHPRNKQCKSSFNFSSAQQRLDETNSKHFNS
eukprot:TRINITY_DN2577_c1_g1_i2.p1 TRINITY_DN2577_c1_g1~~TRINITY_DN2577_c1_g1_i2.p1  ORF type:complete len:254 (+),score=32.01 TRINITY_DN2577_c1_g1_i2:343-1104(+)